MSPLVLTVLYVAALIIAVYLYRVKKRVVVKTVKDYPLRYCSYGECMNTCIDKCKGRRLPEFGTHVDLPIDPECESSCKTTCVNMLM